MLGAGGRSVLDREGQEVPMKGKGASETSRTVTSMLKQESAMCCKLSCVS